jgi:hypothetical protein
MSRYVLEPLADVEGWPALAATAGPALRGTSGNDYICGHCGEGVMARQVPEDSFFGLALRCHACGEYSQAPTLPAGRVTGAKHRIAMAPGSYEEDQDGFFPIDVPPGVCFVSYEVNGRLRLESPAAKLAARSWPGEDVNAEYVWALIKRAVVLLGDRHRVIEASHRRGQAGTIHRPSNPHPLLRLLDEAEKTALALSAGRRGDPRPILELQTLLQLVDAWGDQPQAAEVIKSFSDPGEFRHGLVMLAAASSLTRLGNQVELNPTRRAGRSADLRLALGNGHFLQMEVKAPPRLSHPTKRLDDTDARALLKTAFKSATRGQGGQLSPSSPGVLIVGGVALTSADLHVLQGAAIDILEERKKRYVAGVLLLSTNHSLSEPPSSISPGARLSASTDMAWVGSAHFRSAGQDVHYTLSWREYKH